MCDICGFKEAKQADGEVSQRGDDLRTVLGSDLAAVLIKGDIADVVEAVFNSPMSAVQLKQAPGVGFFGTEAGDPVDGLLGSFLALQMKDLSADREDLADVWELKVVIQLGRGPNLSDFQPAVSLIDGLVLRGENRPSGGLRCPFGGFVDYP